MEGSSAITSSDFSGVLTALQGQLSVANIVEVLAVVVGAGIGFVFMWWGVRKLMAYIQKTALRGGGKV